MARGKRLIDDERAMIVNAYKFFLKGRQGDDRVAGRARELVHQCLGTPTSTVALIWRAYKTHEGADTSKPPPFYKAVVIATMYGHSVSYTPPYHPELQPIELIWGNMKGWIGRNPAKNVSELEEKVEASKGRIVSEDWQKAYRSIQKEEDKYLQALEDDETECADIEEVSGDNDAADSQ
ncbi:hypothetical protein JG688_00014893 [Phytophthora aleatoria]|uniref:Tc1-like transposase DDE domain-containing protein n=1 Tax=Phytophthora aleatoria TaxID=2496075 RepID=A0A8J5LX91_9STRA|nr:hypothetical protein JG688_00014893 [Phytophthora aleatoria]